MKISKPLNIDSNSDWYMFFKIYNPQVDMIVRITLSVKLEMKLMFFRDIYDSLLLNLP